MAGEANMEFWLRAFEECYRSGVEASRSGDGAKARTELLRAAEYLYKLASATQAGRLKTQRVEKADELVWLAKGVAATSRAKPRRHEAPAREQVQPGEEESVPGSDFLLKEKPSVRLDDVAGLDDVKAVLREKVILPFQHREVYERFRAEAGAGILLYGPPGNGKTFVAKAIAGEVDAAFFEVRLSEIKSKYVGETAKNIARLFEEAQTYERAVLFLDEAESLLGKRGNRKIDSVAQFLALTDGMQERRNCLLVMAATNKPWALDEAVLRPGRLGVHVYVGLPDATARAAICRYHLRGVPGADAIPYDEVAARTEGYSGADLKQLCDRAKQPAINRQVRSGRAEVVLTEDVAAALEKSRPSTSREQVDEFVRWRDARAKPADDGDDGE